jgi:hypothetical protein
MGNVLPGRGLIYQTPGMNRSLLGLIYQTPGMNRSLLGLINQTPTNKSSPYQIENS